MRQVRKNTSGNGVQGGFPKEGMSEGPSGGGKFYTGDEVAHIKKRRAELVLEGKNDGQISRVLAGEMNKNAKALFKKICSLFETGEVGGNPNKKEQLDFKEEEIALLRKRRVELILEGKRDTGIARILAGELVRSYSTLINKIKRLVALGEFEENPNKKECNHFSEVEVAKIKERRAQLLKLGKTDNAISAVLALEMERHLVTVNRKIRELVDAGGLPENPSKKEKPGFSPEETERLKKRRGELALEGKTDNSIGEILAGELGKTATSTMHKIHQMVVEGDVGPNPNKQEVRKFKEEEIAFLKRRRAELILQGKVDTHIARILSGEMEKRTAGSLAQKIMVLVESGKLPENPNKFGREINEDELALQLSSAVDMYLGDSP